MFYWNPPREAFTIPVIDHPVVWYGILFVMGFILSYYIVYGIFKKLLGGSREDALYLTDRLTWFVVGGTLIGARLGYVLFYDLQRYLHHPVEIIQIWKGGLASHGGMIGVLISIYLYALFIRKKYPQFSFLKVVDIVATAAPLAACFIRLGNFMNQEILGTPTHAPWAVIFGNPADGSFPEPRHPVVLYEAASYLFIFVFLYMLWKRMGSHLKPGMISGLMFILISLSRIILEFWKMPQEGFLEDQYLQTGQYLSIPFIVLGLVLFFSDRFKRVA